MKIIFGNTLPEGYVFTNLDSMFYENLVGACGDFEKAVDNLVEAMLDSDIHFWTCNPLIPNFLEDAVARGSSTSLSKANSLSLGTTSISATSWNTWLRGMPWLTMVG